MPVYKSIQLVATSEKNWADAVKTGYEEAKKRCLTNFQRKYISSLLRKNNGNIGRTAEEMGVTRQGLAKMMKACGLASE